MVLRLTEVGDASPAGAFFDVEVVGLQAQSYVEVVSSCRRYRAELGLRRPDGDLIVLVASNEVVLPAAAPADSPGLREPAAQSPPVRSSTNRRRLYRPRQPSSPPTSGCTPGRSSLHRSRLGRLTPSRRSP